MSNANIFFIFLLTISFPIQAKCDSFCGNQTYYQEPKGLIITNQKLTDGSANCSWSIETPKRSVLFIKIENLKLGSYAEKYVAKKNCLFITSSDQQLEYMELCADTAYFDSLTIPTNKLTIRLQVSSSSYLSLTYASYIVNCSYNETKCYNSRFYQRKANKICAEGMLACEGSCRQGSVICGGLCYDVQKQRCDGIIDCPTAEDELSCKSNECPNKIRCPNEPKCLMAHQICDGNVDCNNKFDESNCQNLFCNENGTNCKSDKNKDVEQETSNLTYILTIIFGVMVLLFLCLICKCLARRDNIRHMLDDQLDIPLPPFRGPGENSVEDAHYNDDNPGKDIYENFIANLVKIKNNRKTRMESDEKDITFIKPAEKENRTEKCLNELKPILSEEMAALATLKITRDMCRGLKKTKSEERPITRRLFLDNKDDISDDNDEENYEPAPSTAKTPTYRPTYSKSDSTYVRRKNIEASFV